MNATFLNAMGVSSDECSHGAIRDRPEPAPISHAGAVVQSVRTLLRRRCDTRPGERAIAAIAFHHATAPGANTSICRSAGDDLPNPEPGPRRSPNLLQYPLEAADGGLLGEHPTHVVAAAI